MKNHIIKVTLCNEYFTLFTKLVMWIFAICQV